jgi:hypothetical protein
MKKIYATFSVLIFVSLLACSPSKKQFSQADLFGDWISDEVEDNDN